MYNNDEFDDEDYIVYDDYDAEDNDRDLFYTLTDGQYGDYDEWRRNCGDIDSLMDRLGY